MPQAKDVVPHVQSGEDRKASESRHLRETGRGTKPAAKKRTKASEVESLRSLTKAELYKKASVEGRSGMTWEQLADALFGDGRQVLKGLRVKAAQARVASCDASRARVLQRLAAERADWPRLPRRSTGAYRVSQQHRAALLPTPLPAPITAVRVRRRRESEARRALALRR